MANLAQRAEILKLARLLGVDEAALGYLDKLDAAAIRSFREQATAMLFDADRARFQGMANASRLLPLPILVRIVEKVFGPLLCARVAGLLPAARAIEISERLETPYLVEVCLQLDPRSARELVAHFPTARVVAIARELARRGELVTMGRFVDSISIDAITAVTAAIEDDATLLRIAFFAEDAARLNEIVELLPAARLRRIIRVAATGAPTLWGEALALFTSVDAALTAKLAALTGEQDDAVLAQIVASTQAIGRWDTLLPIVSAMDAAQQRRVANLPALADDAVLQALVEAALASSVAGSLRQLSTQMAPPLYARLEKVARRLGVELVAAPPKRRAKA